MKKILALILIFIAFLVIVGCRKAPNDDDVFPPRGENMRPPNEMGDIFGSQGEELKSDESSYGESLDSLGANDGYFEEDVADITIKRQSGTENAYTLENGVLTFTALGEDSVYSISGKLRGSIIIDIGENYKLDLELTGLSLACNTASPITILSGSKVSITAKNGYKNYIYDEREPINEEDERLHPASIYSTCDLEICGKGSLNIVSKSNNGIHTRDDLEIKNLTLLVSCKDNALKGNDGVEIEGGNLTLISTQGDGIKTTNSHISDKGNQKGAVRISGGSIEIYSACDGIDSAYDVIIDKDSSLNIYTDKYSTYSEEITAVSEDLYYIRFSSKYYTYSVKYYNSDTDYEIVNATYHSSVSGGRNSYYYYSFPKKEYSKLKFIMYSSDMEQGQESEYVAISDYFATNPAYDTIALSVTGSNLYYNWTSYTTQIQGGGPGMGGMQEGNTEKGDYSTKGIKASNEIQILGGSLNIKSYDDSLHANSEATLENGNSATGCVKISGGDIKVYSNDDGIHADGELIISGGTINVSYSYEGLEGTQIKISGGNASVSSRDDGVNSTATSDTGVEITGGSIYIYAGGDGIDSNSRTSYKGISFQGGRTVVISTSGGNSAIDTESGYEYLGGHVVAIMPSGGMSSEATHAFNFSEVATKKSISLSEGKELIIEADEEIKITIPTSMSALVIYLGSSSADISTK